MRLDEVGRLELCSAPLYGVRSCRLATQSAALFAVAGPKLWILQVSLRSEDDSGPRCIPKVVCAWAVPRESFFTADFTTGADAAHTLCCAGGLLGQLHIFNVHTRTRVDTMQVAQDEIAEVAAHPSRGGLVAVAARDLAVRIVDVHARRTLYTLGGIDGHRDGVLGVAWCADRSLVSCGMDNTVRRWDLPALERHGAASHQQQIHGPTTCTAWPHANYVDCVAALGDGFYLSKSTEGEIVLWRHNVDTENDDGGQLLVADTDCRGGGARPTFLAAFAYPCAGLWYFKFALAPPVLVVGTSQGQVHAWHVGRALDQIRDRAIRVHIDPAGTPADAALGVADVVSPTVHNEPGVHAAVHLPRNEPIRMVAALAGDDLGWSQTICVAVGEYGNVFVYRLVP